MAKIKIPILLILVFFAWNSSATNRDSSLINNLKKFIISETGFPLDPNFYTAWSKSEKPFINLYISSSKKVDSPYKFNYTSYGTKEELAKERAAEEVKLGHHAFIYKTYATSAAELNDRFLLYSAESKCFIIFHEFIHHYKNDLKLAIPYEFEEALGDVVGNYGAMEFMRVFEDSRSSNVKEQKLRNEKIYKIINRTTDIINRSPEKVDGLHRNCQKRIEKILRNGDSFQKDRFDYQINNGYLLKNRFYSEKYFLLKRVFLKTETLSEFLNIIKKCPSDPKDFEAYLNRFL